ncbi:MAG: segregation/condensation protein A [Desulfobacterales bacterium]|nr:segregation/condensation protein A [Deltaproteobacteria bacterium]NNL78153.1 segregation/condensation protein A [Desulfobacterales bacterium]
MPEKLYRVHLDDIFEGPMDLLVHLIRKNELDIYDIPIAMITEQYLQYLEWMQAMNIDYAGDFILMASTLTQLKSRMLLPSHGDEDEEEDPLQEITRPLLEYLQMKSAADSLVERNLLGEKTFIRNPNRDEFMPGPDDEFIKVGLFELIDAFQKILEKIPDDHRVEFSADVISIKDKISQIVEILEAQGSITFLELFSDSSDKHEIIVTFLAILEMVKLTLIRIVQHVHTGIIRIFYL